MIKNPQYNWTYDTTNAVEYPYHGVIDVPERFHDFPCYELQLARPIRALHPRMRPRSPDYNVQPRAVRCDPGFGPGFGVNRPDVTKLQPPKDIVNKAPMQQIGPHPHTPRRYPNNFLSRLYEDDGRPVKYEYGYVPRSHRDMVDVLAHHRSYSTSTRDMTEESKLPLEPRRQPTTTIELEADRAADRWKRYNPRPEEWQLCGHEWDRAQHRPMIGHSRDLFEPRAMGQDRFVVAREQPEMKPEFQMIRDLIAEDLLPQPLEKPLTFYAGFVPRKCVDTTLEPRKQQPDKYLSVTRKNFYALPSCEYQQPRFPQDGRFSKTNAMIDPFCKRKPSRTDPIEPPSNFFKYF